MVNGSPPLSFAGVEFLERREVVDGLDASDGDPARVLDTFTAKESLEPFDPVRKANAANRGRGAAGTTGALALLTTVALLLRRAAS